MIGIAITMEVTNLNNSSVPIDINRSNWSNKNTFTEIIYIDTNAVIDIVAQRPKGLITESYLQELVKRDGMITWSQHTLDEITDFFHVNEYIQYAKSNGIQGNSKKAPWKLAEDTISNSDSIILSQNVVSKVGSVMQYLEQFGIKTEVDNHDMIDLTKDIYLQFGGNRKDSQHMAISNLSGINSILTQDSGFLRYPHLNVFSASHKVASQYDANQKHAKYIDLRNSDSISEEDEEVS